MAREIVFTPNAAKPPPAYSQAVKAAGLVFVSGTAPTDPTTGAIKGATIQEQTRQCLTNIRAILEAAGTSLANLVKTTVFLQNLDDFAGMNEVYSKHVGERPPARSTVEVAKLPSGALVEIEAIALI